MEFIFGLIVGVVVTGFVAYMWPSVFSKVLADGEKKFDDLTK